MAATQHRPLHALLGGGAAADLLLWRRRNASATAVTGATLVWFVFERAGYSLASVLSNALLLLVIILFFWAKSASLLNSSDKSRGFLAFAFAPWISGFLPEHMYLWWPNSIHFYGLIDMNFLRLQFSEKTAIRDFVNLTMGDREEELRRGSCSGEVGRSPAGRGTAEGVPKARKGASGAPGRSSVRLLAGTTMVGASWLRAGRGRADGGKWNEERRGVLIGVVGGSGRKCSPRIGGGKLLGKLLPWPQKEAREEEEEEGGIGPDWFPDLAQVHS
ncbi:hypothetical protein ZWY2020_021274 [Hordeum vulgare]|nr:hypothetical protein ZWY2020_021274 [Hordeum vulgare]